MRRVGILGGMGPEATVLLMQKVIAAVSATDDADHVPLIVDQNTQVPSRIRRLIEGSGDDPGPVLAAMARRLEAAGAEALAMACNTAHHYADDIRAAVRVPFLDMVALASDHATELAGPGGTIGILASPAIRRVGLFEAAFAARGIHPLYPESDAAMLAIVRRIKAVGPDTEARAALGTAAAELCARGAVVQMIACTEFSLIAASAAEVEVRMFDALDQLAQAIVTFSREAER